MTLALEDKMREGKTGADRANKGMAKPRGTGFQAAFLALALAFIIGPAIVGSARAAEPGYYRVTDVAAGDVLNVRADPDAQSDIVSEYTPDAHPIEVLEVVTEATGEWGRVLAADGNGWVAMRFLSPETVETIVGTLVPIGLQCGGTEPFWSLTAAAGSLNFSAIDLDAVSRPLVAATTAIGRNNRFGLVASDETERMTAMLASGEACSDGMSDRDFGWRIDLLIEGTETRAYEGCCRLPVAE